MTAYTVQQETESTKEQAHRKENRMENLQTPHTITRHTTNETPVRNLYQRLMDGWNQGSGAAFAAVFTEDGDLVAFDGTHFHGRREITPFHQELFDKWLKGSRLVGQVKEVRFLTPDIALMHAVGGTVMRGQTQPAPERDSIQTLVAVQEAGEWHIAAFQNTRLRPLGQSGRAFLALTLSDWVWQILRPKR